MFLEVDDNKSTDSDNRNLWFECEDNIKQCAFIYNKSYTDKLPIPMKNQNVTIDDGSFRYLLIYAKEERDSSQQLHEQICTQLKINGINWKALDYHNFLAGQHIEETRQRYYREAQFLLLLLSPKLIVELMDDSLFKESTLAKIPLALKKVTAKQLESIGLNKHHFFTDKENEPWVKRKSHKQDEWVEIASEQIISVMQPDEERHRQKHLVNYLEAGRPDFEKGSREDYVHQQFAENEKQAIPYLLDWLADPIGEVFCAIVGELGMGKTTLCQRITQILLDERKQKSSLPFPVYFDLRSANNLNWNWAEKGVPTLEIIIEQALSDTYNLPMGTAKITVDDIKRLAQQQGALIIFDGLDEVMNRLTPEQSNLFIKQLWDILPPAVFNVELEEDAENKHGRLIMTCRSHYFQTIQDQLNALTDQQQEKIKQKDYNWVTLLPLNDKQVESYFRQVFSKKPAQAERVISMLDEIHNLRELSNRPYNMKLIQEQVDILEALQRQDKKVTVIDLYEGMVGQWLLRDNPKHQLLLEHKLELMESLALLLWQDQKQQIKYSKLNTWLIRKIRKDDDLEYYYKSYSNQRQGLDILQQDLRNASFLVRQGEDSFRFVHTSIMEFFLARSLYHALLDNDFEQWSIPLPSDETLDFLAELIAREQTKLCLQNMSVLRKKYHALASEVLLHYVLRAYKKGYAGAIFDQFDLTGAKLKNIQVKALKNKPLNWVQANFSQSDLRDAKFIGINFSQSDFVGSKLDRSLFDDCCLDEVNIQTTSLIGTIFHHCTAEKTDFTGADLNRTQWLPKLSLSVADKQ